MCSEDAIDGASLSDELESSTSLKPNGDVVKAIETSSNVMPTTSGSWKKDPSISKSMTSEKWINRSFFFSYSDVNIEKPPADDKEISQDKLKATLFKETHFELQSRSAVAPRACAEFQPADAVARAFLDDVFDAEVEAKSRIDLAAPAAPPRPARGGSRETQRSAAGAFIDEFKGWPTIDEFDAVLAWQRVAGYLETWKYVEDWVHDVNLVHRCSSRVADFYVFKSVWCIPRKEYPVAQATASVFFVYEVSRIKPRNCDVDICYYFEGRATKHHPDQSVTHEAILFEIVEAKLKFFQTLRF